MFANATPTFRLRREFELLVACLRRDLRPQMQRAPLEEIDWEAFLSLAVRHRVVPQLVRYVKRHPDHALPGNVVDSLVERNTSLLRNNLRLAGELVRIARRFEAESIPLVAFKGPTLAQDLYGSLTDRQFVDLDLLVRSADVRTAVTLFSSLGYIASDVDLGAFRGQQLRRALDDSKSSEFHHASHSELVQVDLHWRLANDIEYFSAPEARLFGCESSCKISGQTIRTIPSGELINYLAFHGGNHRWMRLSWLCDLAKAMWREPRSSWPGLIERSADFGTQRYLISACLLMERLGLIDELPAVVDAGWRGRLERITTEMYEVLSADAVAPLNGVLSDGAWRYRFSGSWKPFANSLIRFLKPKQRDLVHDGWLRPYVSRWQYIASQTANSLWSSRATGELSGAPHNQQAGRHE